MSDLQATILQNAMDALADFEAGEVDLPEFTRQMEQPIHDARARGLDVSESMRYWAEIEIINAIALDESRPPTDDERNDIREAARQLLASFAA